MTQGFAGRDGISSKDCEVDVVQYGCFGSGGRFRAIWYGFGTDCEPANNSQLVGWSEVSKCSLEGFTVRCCGSGTAVGDRCVLMGEVGME